ncbi:hypothetical protein N2152v2_004931 [Parachlorella kessleri]
MQQLRPTVVAPLTVQVVCYDPKYTAKPALKRTLQELGAKVVERLTKQVTHVVYERRTAQRGKEKDAEQELQDLYGKTDKLDPRPLIVSPTWVEQSRERKKRLVEKEYTIQRPKDSLLSKPGSRTPGSGVAHGRKRKQAATAPPKPLDAFDLGELVSSTQQITADGPDGGSTEPGHKLGPSAKKRIRGQTVCTVADIMAGLLGAGEADTPGGDATDQDDGWGDGEGDEDLDTPLSIRLAKSASRSASKDAERRRSGPNGRSRLAQASGPHLEGSTGAAAARAGEAKGAGSKLAQGAGAAAAGGREAAQALQPAQRFSRRQLGKHEAKPMALLKGTPPPGVLKSPTSDVKRPKSMIAVPPVERVISPWQEAEQLLSQSPSQQSQPVAVGRDGQAGAMEAHNPNGTAGLLRRRSLLHVGMPNASPGSGFKPPGPAAVAPWSSLRPWDQRAGQQDRRTQQEQPGEAPVDTGAGRGERNSSKPAVQPSRGNQDPRRATGEVMTGRGILQENVGAAGRSKIVAPKLKPAAQKAGATLVGAGLEVANACTTNAEHQQEQHRQQQPRRGRQRAAPAAPVAAAAQAAKGVGEQQPEEPDPDVVMSDTELATDGIGPLQGYIAVTSVDPGVVELCKSAVRRLRGLRLCSDGHEDGKITHLVVVANGAWLVNPEWVTASLEAERWLPESQYLAKVRFVAAAEKARCQLEMPDEPPLLHDFSIYFHEGQRNKAAGQGQQATNSTALKRVALALGAKVVPPKTCTLCVVVGGGSRPTHIPKQVPAVKEEWLLMAAEGFKVPSTTAKPYVLR